MKKTTKQDLIQDIAKRRPYTQGMTKEVVETFLKVVRERVAEGPEYFQGIGIRNFGTLFVKRRAGRPGRNVRTGAVVMVPPFNTLLWKPSPYLIQEMNAAARGRKGAP